MAVAQSSIGLQVFSWDSESTKFKYLVPITGDLPPMGSAPATIECTEADSPVKQYIADRADNPAIELSYNYLAEYEDAIKKVLNPTTPHNFMILLPLGTGIIFEATGDTWLDGGSPIQGKISFIQGRQSIKINNKSEVFTQDQVGLLAVIGITALTSQKLEAMIDWDSIPAGKINQKPTE